MTLPIESSILYLLSPSLEIAGAGWLVSDCCAVTCAHLVQAAVSVGSLSFRYAGANEVLQAMVLEKGRSTQDDVVFLQLPKTERKPLAMGYGDEGSGHPFAGLTAASSPVWAAGIIGGVVHQPGSAEPVLEIFFDEEQAGLPGAPVIDRSTGLAVGMLLGAQAEGQPGAQNALICETLQLHMPELELAHQGAEVRGPVSQAPSAPFQPHPASPTPELRHLIGRAAELEQLQHRLASLRQKKNSQVVFISGPFGSGVKALGRALVEANASLAACLITRFWELSIVSVATMGDPRWSIELKTSEEILAKASFLSQPEFTPLAPLLAQAIRQKLVNEEALGKLRSPEHVPPLLAALDSAKQVVVLLEDFELAAAPWITFLKTLAQPGKNQAGRLTVVCVHSEAPLEQAPAAERSLLQALAHELKGKGQAEFIHLGPVQKSDIAAYLGRSQPALAHWLYRQTKGMPLLVENLWESLYGRGQVNQRFDGAWELDPRSSWQQRPAAQDYIDEILTELYNQPDAPGWGKDVMLDILRCAAREGPIFTAEALADTFRLNLDDLLATFDYILDGEFEDGYDQLGLVVDSPAESLALLEIGWSHVLHRFRFEPLVVWRGLMDGPKPAPERLAQFADGLARAYWPFLSKPAAALERLYRHAGNPDRAKQFQALTQGKNQIALVQAEIALLEQSQPGAAQQARLLDLHKRLVMEGPAAGIGFENQRRSAVQMLELAKGLNLQSEKVYAEFQIAEIDYVNGRASAAARSFENLVAVYESTGLEDFLMVCLLRLGDIHLMQGRRPKAEDYFQRAQDIATEHGDSAGMAMALKGLAAIAAQQGKKDQAASQYHQAIQLFQELGIPAQAAACQAELNKIKPGKR